MPGAAGTGSGVGGLEGMGTCSSGAGVPSSWNHSTAYGPKNTLLTAQQLHTGSRAIPKGKGICAATVSMNVDGVATW